MWRETDLFGIYVAPLVVYALLAFALLVLVRAVVLRAGLYRWIWNPTLAEAAAFVCILGLLVGFL